MPKTRTWRAGGGAGRWQRPASTLASLVLVCAAAAGCYRSPGAVTVYEPGVYKGTPDPLVKKSGTPEHAEALHERFTMAATDR